jgi:hypothetical protein
MGMKRFVIAVVLSGAAAFVAVSPGATVASAPRAALEGYVCQTARDPAARGIEVTAVMRPVARTMRMAMRFQLFDRQRRSGRWAELHGQNLDVWLTPPIASLGQRPRDVWKERHPIAQLSVAPAYYRVKVTFRWIGPHNRTLATAIRYSPTCFQPELRPDLAVAGVDVRPVPSHPNRYLYSALIKNRGASASGPFTVQFADSAGTRTQSVQQLAAHSKTAVSFHGSACDPLSPPTITVDPTGQVDDFNRANNAAKVTCPAS